MKYITWKDKRKLKYIRNEDQSRPAHLKFTDYHFEKNEFMNRLSVAIKYVEKKKLAYFKKNLMNHEDASLNTKSATNSKEIKGNEINLDDSIDNVNNLPKTEL